VDAYMNRNSDIPIMNSEDEQVEPLVAKSKQTAQDQESRDDLPTHSSNASIYVPAPISPFDGATTNDQLPGVTSAEKTQNWNIVNYQIRYSSGFPPKFANNSPMSQQELQAFDESDVMDTASNTSEQVGTVEPLCSKALAEAIPKFEKVRLNSEAERNSETCSTTFHKKIPTSAKAGSNLLPVPSNPKKTRPTGSLCEIYRSLSIRLDMRQRRARAKIFSKLPESPKSWELWTFTANDMKRVYKKMHSELQARLCKELEHSAMNRKRRRCSDENCIYEESTEPRRRLKLRRMRNPSSLDEGETPEGCNQSLDDAMERHPELRIWDNF